jgi:hypothetical protein
VFADLTVLGPDRKVVENMAPTEGEVALELGGQERTTSAGAANLRFVEAHLGKLVQCA